MMFSEEQWNAFRYEIENWNNIPITDQVCGVGCIFCKLTGDPAMKRFPQMPTITMEELLKGFSYINSEYKYVRLGAGVMVSTKTDPFLHPQIYEFIEAACKQFPNNKVTTVTTGSYIDLDKISFLKSLPNYGIDLSLNTMNRLMRSKLMMLTTYAKIQRILAEGPLNKISLVFTENIEILREDLELLKSYGLPRNGGEILVRRLEHTKNSPQALKKISEMSISGFSRCAEFLKMNYPYAKYTVPELNELYKDGTKSYFKRACQLVAQMKNLFNTNKKIHYVVLSPDSMYEFLEKELKEEENVKIHRIPNSTYGGSVTVSGLLTNQDIRNEKNRIPKGDTYMLPKLMYDNLGLDLLGESRDALLSELDANIIYL